LGEFETPPSPKSQNQEIAACGDPRNWTGEFAAGLAAFTENAADGSGASTPAGSRPFTAARRDSATTARALKRVGVMPVWNLILAEWRERNFRNS
jgi:hypothetical protein